MNKTTRSISEWRRETAKQLAEAGAGAAEIMAVTGYRTSASVERFIEAATKLKAEAQRAAEAAVDKHK